MKVIDIYKTIDSSIAPFLLAEEWDNVGLLVGDEQAEVQGVLVALDATPAVIDEAVAWGCQLVVTHHPVIFQPLKSITAQTVPYKAIGAGVSIISAHTNWDKVQGGVNDRLAAALGLKGITLMDGEEGFCRVGHLAQEATPEGFALTLLDALGLPPRYNPGGRPIARVGVCGGAGADMALSAAAIEQGIDAFVTADVKHHQYIEAAGRGITLYDAGHYATENLATETLCNSLARLLPSLTVRQAESYSGEVLYSLP